MHGAGSATENGRAKGSGEATCATGGQHMVGASDVVPKGGGAMGPDEDAAGRGDFDDEGRGLVVEQLEVLGCQGIRQADCVVDRWQADGGEDCAWIDPRAIAQLGCRSTD